MVGVSSVITKHILNRFSGLLSGGRKDYPVTQLEMVFVVDGH